MKYHCKVCTYVQINLRFEAAFQRAIVMAIHLLLPSAHLWVVDDGHDDEEGGDEDEQGRHADEHLKTDMTF